jgi:hypothetical protein
MSKTQLVCRDCQGARNFPIVYEYAYQMGSCYYCGVRGLHAHREILRKSYWQWLKTLLGA